MEIDLKNKQFKIIFFTKKRLDFKIPVKINRFYNLQKTDYMEKNIMSFTIKKIHEIFLLNYKRY